MKDRIHFLSLVRSYFVSAAAKTRTLIPGNDGNSLIKYLSAGVIDVNYVVTIPVNSPAGRVQTNRGNHNSNIVILRNVAQFDLVTYLRNCSFCKSINTLSKNQNLFILLKVFL